MLHLQTLRTSLHSTLTVKNSSNASKSCNSSIVLYRKKDNTEMLQRKQQMRGKAHYSPKYVVRPPCSLFTCLATTQQAKETLIRDPGVVSLHVNEHLKKIRIIYSHFRPCAIIFSSCFCFVLFCFFSFLAYPSFFHLNNAFIPILGHQHCGSEWKSQRSLLNDMGKTEHRGQTGAHDAN